MKKTEKSVSVRILKHKWLTPPITSVLLGNEYVTITFYRRNKTSTVGWTYTAERGKEMHIKC
jgi:hypothetical protein